VTSKTPHAFFDPSTCCTLTRLVHSANRRGKLPGQTHPMQVGRDFEKPGLVKGVPAHGRGVGTRWSL